MDFADFFNAVRKQPFGGSLTQQAVDGLTALVGAFDQYGDGDRRKLAYILGTAFHESDRFKTMEEYASGAAYEGRASLGNTEPGDGKRFKGRGFVQVTGRRNYTDWSKRLDIDLVGNPELAEGRKVAARICVEGMMKGTFTGRRLDQYITPADADYVDARRTVNGTDKAAQIAAYARQFDAALVAASYGQLVPLAAPEPAIVEPTPVVCQETPVRDTQTVLSVTADVQPGLPAVLGSVSKAMGAAKGAAKGASIPSAVALVAQQTGLFPAWIFKPTTILALSLIVTTTAAAAWAFYQTYHAPPNKG